MALLNTTLQQHNIYEYLIVLQPHEELWQRIVKVKEDFADKYKSDYARWGKPHITLVNFVQYQAKQERIMSKLSNIAKIYKPVKVELNGFGSFPSHTIYINVTSKIPIQTLIKKIRTETQLLMKMDSDNKPHFIMEPHVTIARRLLPWQYEKAWLEYSHKNFTATFIASGILILKRPMGEMKYEIVRFFEFENLPIETKQGELFM